ncbi:unnamed protein product [Spirodela intermedia]|uniref:Uncharacterized protein n=1 Tax=Spirodela intermedia TaxID=51605 RepID=A0A7I8IZ63_SPIIN|nr:unnamed protein product [Spirodela intermedia]CAA6663264.1 unnamed protein product [Spirodela intermedia]
MHHPLNPLLEISEEESGLPGAGPHERAPRNRITEWGEHLGKWIPYMGWKLGFLSNHISNNHRFNNFETQHSYDGSMAVVLDCLYRWGEVNSVKLCPMVKHVLWGVMLERYQNTKNKLHKPYELKMYACYTPDDFGFSIRLHILFHVFTEVRHPSKPQFLQLVPHLNWSNADLICHLSLPPASLNDPTQAAAGLILIN